MIQENEIESVEFKWGVKRRLGGKKKDVQFYESFMYDGVEYWLYDTVYMYKENEPEPFIGKIIKIWEPSDKTKKVKILWFFRPCEISNYLQDNIASENELFLASGNGAGLANINPLEAIAGKCNAVCISKDGRNPHPSIEELETADFIFYRTFDVGRLVVSDKIDDEIAGVDVKLLFNKDNSQKSIVPEFLDKRDIPVKLTKGTVVLPENALGDSKIHVKSPLIEKPSSVVDIELAEMVKNDHTQESLSGDKRMSTSKSKENVVAEQKSSLGVKYGSDLCEKFGEEFALDDLRKSSAVDTINSRSKGKEILDLKPTRMEPKSFPTEGNENTSVEIGRRTSYNARESVSYDNIFLKSEDRLVSIGTEACKFSTSTTIKDNDYSRTMKDSQRVDGEQCEKEPLRDCEEVYDETKNTIKNSHHDSRRSEFKHDQISILSTEKLKRKLANDSQGGENNSSKKSKLEGKLTSHVDYKLLEVSPREVPNKVRKSSSKTFEVTPRPEVEKRSKWFKGLPWQEWIPNAQEQGRLVLLQNLDPSYTTEDVQDIVWHAFGESCSALLIQRTAILSPYSGQAFVIFKTRQAAKDIVKKLDEGCLYLSNGRPLLGSIANLGFLGKQTTFFGHISIDRIKLHMQRDMKEAVATSHFSQPNTVEYDLAMDWCLLQERSDLEWNKLYKRHGRELRDLKETLKSK